MVRKIVGVALLVWESMLYTGSGGSVGGEEEEVWEVRRKEVGEVRRRKWGR